MTRNYLDILAEIIRNNWNQPALTDFYLTEDGKAQDTSRGNHYTYGEMYEEIVRIADLLTNHGLQKGDHIAICGANSSRWVIAYLAIAKMQGVSVTVMNSLLPTEIAHLVDSSDAKALFVDGELWEELKEGSLPQVQSVICLEDWNLLRGEKITNYKSQITNGEIGFSPVEQDSLAMICFTSGSTGGAKGVMLSYRSLTNNIQQLRIRMYDYMNKNSNHTISLTPFSHLLGLVETLLVPLSLGCSIYFPQQILTLQVVIETLNNVRPFVLITTPFIINKLLSKNNENFRSIKYIITGGAPLSENVESTLFKQGIRYFSRYGTTETGPSITADDGTDIPKQSCGKIIEGMTCRITPNGEILVKGENVMLGYYKDPEATTAKIDKDGWLHTGDKGHLDEDGYLYVEGRLDQDIIVLPNGENIRPDNIEALINAMPEVKESIVLARDGKLVAIVVSQITNADLKLNVLHQINPQLPLYSQLDKVEISDAPLARTEKQTLKRYLYH